MSVIFYASLHMSIDIFRFWGLNWAIVSSPPPFSKHSNASSTYIYIKEDSMFVLFSRLTMQELTNIEQFCQKKIQQNQN
jgi:hypothetical protein